MPRGVVSTLLHPPVSPETIRGVKASVVRSGFGQYLLHSRGSAATYELSSQSSQIDEFLSHSWSSSGRLKWLSLCLHHNGVAAVSAALIAGVLATVLEIAGLGTLPVVRHRWFDGQIRSIVFGPYLAAYSAFLLALLFWRWPDRVMFLDKICIHQTDAELTRRGIASINPIIRSSSSLLLCYEPDAAPGEGYFDRLWCNFELAAFVTKEREAGRATDRLVVLPLWRPVCVLVLQAGLVVAHGWEYASVLLGAASWSFSKGYVAKMTTALLIPFWLDIAGEEQKSAMLRQLRDFRFERAKCGDPADRDHVHAAIEELYGADSPWRRLFGEGDGGGGASGVERFEHDVRRGDVFRAVEHALGRQVGVLTRFDIVTAFLPSVFRAFAYFPRNLEAQPNLFLFHGVVIMGVSPLCREAALRAYCAVALSETLRRLALPQQVARTLASLGTAAFFSVLVLAFSFPFTRLLKLIY